MNEESMTLGSRLRDFFVAKPETFALDPRFFPESTRSVFTPEQITRLRILPLGFKTLRRFLGSERKLNVGFVDPSDSAAIREVRSQVAGKFESQETMEIQVFRIDEGEYRRILSEIYGIAQGELSR